MSEELLGGWDEAIANLAKPTTDKLSQLGIDVNALQNNMKTQADNVRQVTDEIQAAGAELDSLGVVSPQARNYQTDKELAQLQYEEAPYLGTNLISNMREDRRANYERTKKLVHDISHESSGEQAIADWFQLKAYESDKPNMLQPEQAHALSKELGIERKFDKPVTEGKVRFEVAKAQLHEARQKELNYFMETGEYSSFQNLMIGGAALSGAFTGLDMAGVAAASWLGWLGTAKTLEGLAQAAKTTKDMTNVAQAIRFARKMALIEKKSAACQDAVLAAQESLALKTGLFAADAVVSDLPRVALKVMDSSIKNDNSFSGKEMIGELMMDAAIGAGIPLTGAALKSAKNAIFGEAKTEIKAVAQEKAGLERLKGHEGSAQEIEKSQKEVEQVLTEAQYEDKVNIEPVPAQQNFTDNAVAYSSMNLTEAEHATLEARVARALHTGDMQDLRTVLTELPFRHTYYSNVEGMLDRVTEAASKNMTGREFFTEVLSKLPIEVEHMETTNYLEGVRRFLNTLEPASIKVREKGALGRSKVYGLTSDMAANLDFNIRKALFLDNTEAGIEAGLAAEQALKKLQQIKNHIDEIINTHQDIFDINQAAKSLRNSGKKYSGLRHKDQDIFKRPDGTFGTLEDMLKDLADLLLPEDIQNTLRDFREFVRKENSYKSIVGHNSEEYLANKQKYDSIRQVVDDWQKEVVDKLGHHTTYKFTDGATKEEREIPVFRLKALMEGTDQAGTESAYLKALSQKLDEMITSNSSMRNTDFIFEDVYKDKMQELADAMVVGDRIPELEYSYTENAFQSLEPKTLLKEETELLGTYETAKQNYAATEGSTIRKIASEISDAISEEISTGVRSTEKGSIPFRVNELLIPKLEELISTSFEPVQRALIETLQKNAFFKNVSAKLAEGAADNNLAGLIKAHRREFNKAVTMSITTQLRDALPQHVMPRSLADKITEAGDKFVEMLSSMKAEDIKTLFEAPEIAISKETPAKAVEEELAKREQQRNIFAKILSPYFKKVSESLTEYTTSLYADQQRTLNIVEKALSKPGRADEMLLGSISGDYVPGKGSSLTMENLADARPDRNMVLMRWKKLGENNGHNTDTLEEVSKDITQYQSIMKDMQTIYRKGKGLLTKEEEQAFQANSQSAMIAQGLMDQLQKISDDIYRKGGGRWNFFSLIDNSKLHGDKFIFRSGKNMLGSQVHRVLVDNKIFNKFFQSSDDKVTDKLLYLFENMDLDDHFNANNFSNIGFNELRNALLETHGEGTTAGYRALIRQYGEEQVKKSIEQVEDSLIKFFNKMISDSIPIDPHSASFTAKYLEEGKPLIRFKSPEAEIEAAKWYGYDNFTKLMDSSLMKAKRVYSIVSVAGVEPYQLMMGAKDMVEAYANHIAPTKHGIENANKMVSRFSQTFERNYEYLVNRMCGTYSTPAKSWPATLRLITSAFGSPMIMASAFKGLSDYGNMCQYIFSAGWHSAKDVNYRLRTLPKLRSLIPRLNTKDSRFLKEMHLLNLVDQESLYSALTNGDTLTAGQEIGDTLGANIKNFLRTITDINRGKTLSLDAPGRMKWEEGIRAWGDLVMHIGRIGESSDINRGNAAIMVMQAIADNGNTLFKNLDKKAQQSLNRYGVSEWEWDNIFTKHCINTIDEHLAKYRGEGGEYFGDFKVFTPDNLAELDDSVIEGFIKANPEKSSVVTKQAIANYRQELFDKASIMINSGADEMVSIPNERVKAWLRGYTDPNSWTGATWSMATQFQSFGAMMNWTHWTRRWMSFIDPSDELFTNFALATGGMWSGQVQSFTGMVAEMAIYQGMILEALSYANGKYQSIYSSSGELQPDVLSKKLIKPFIDTTGSVGILLDAIMGAVSIGRGQGGGISFPIAPVPSATISGAGKVINAATRQSTEGHRAEAVLAQIAQNALDVTGIPRIPVLQAGYTMMIGDRLSEIAQGSSAWNRTQARRRRTGYQRNWAYDARDFVEDTFTNR